MVSGCFYFVKESFYSALPNCGLMTNKGDSHGRPCHYCFEADGFFWLVPISSKIEKYQKIYDSKMAKRGMCDGIRFGYVNGEKRAFLIQNAFPITEKYIDGQYFVEKGKVVVTVNEALSKELNRLLKKCIRLYNRGIPILFTNIDAIKEYLQKDK